MLKFRWLNVLKVLRRNWSEVRSVNFNVLNNDMFQTFSPGVLTVLRATLAKAPTPACTKRAFGSTATYPTVFAEGQAALVGPTTRVSPPAPSLQIGRTVVPVKPTPAGLKMVRSPALSPLAFESTPERGVTGWPDCAR